MGMTWKDVAHRLLVMPDAIYAEELNQIGLSDKIERDKLALAHLRLDIYMQVEAETTSTTMSDGTTKAMKVFSNQEKRDIETDKRLELNDQASSIKKRTEKDQQDKISQGALLDYHRRQFRAAEALTRIADKIDLT